MASDMFLKLEGTNGKMEGESQDSTHKDEIQVLAWSWGMSQGGTTHIGTGGGAGKVNVQDLSITKYIDKSSTNLIQCCMSGAHFKEGLLTIRKASGDLKAGPLEYLKIKMEDCIITSVSTGGSGGEDKLTENVTINFAKVGVTYVPQDDKGAGLTAKKFGWDIPKNEEQAVK